MWNLSTIQPFNHSTSYYTHDGNKNVSEVIAADCSLAAHYSYAPFGAVVTQSGISAAMNPWRFSSEFFDDITESVYYNFRYLYSDAGVWLGRDRVATQPYDLIYGYCLNNPFLYYDVKGDHPALLILIPLIMFNPSVANAPGLNDVTVTSWGAAGMMVDVIGGKVLSVALKCCGKLLGFVRFRVYSVRAKDALLESLARYDGKAVAIGAFDARTGKTIIKTSGTYVGKSTPAMEVLASKMGGKGIVTECGNTVGCCAEYHAADELIARGSLLEDIRFTEAVRPRSGAVIAPCENCLRMFEENFNSTSIPIKMPDILFVPVSSVIDNE